MSDKIFKYIIFFLVVGTILLIIFNSSTRQLVKKSFEIYRLKKKIAETIVYNEDLQKRLTYLKEKPIEMEKEVKLNLGYIADDEILYKFNDYKEKDKI